MIIGVTGHAQHGKDTVAGFAKARGFKRYAFADNVRRALYALNPVVWIAGEVNEETGEEDTNSGWCVRLQPLIENLGGIDGTNTGAGEGWDNAKKLPEVRQLLQRMGTESVRDVVNDEAWVMALRRQLDWEKPDRVVITDVRFPSEAAAVKAWGGTMIRVVRLTEEGDQFVVEGIDLHHGSEAHVETLPVDHEIRATALEDLESAVTVLLDGMKL